jgi:hypothetical protein
LEMSVVDAEGGSLELMALAKQLHI